MCKLNKKSGLTRIDPCMRNLIQALNNSGFDVRACCCGHKKYNMSIVVYFNTKEFKGFFDLMTMIDIPRIRRFYKRDKAGHYYIPEVSNE